MWYACNAARTSKAAVILVVTERAVSHAVTEVLLVDALTGLRALVLPHIASYSTSKYKCVLSLCGFVNFKQTPMTYM